MLCLILPDPDVQLEATGETALHLAIQKVSPDFFGVDVAEHQTLMRILVDHVNVNIADKKGLIVLSSKINCL
ncbi:hypothetical protein M1146_03435 [Patescibacteria group bacterium]|nr:hypothetical protein [Patescibacteria group bacterium]